MKFLTFLNSGCLDICKNMLVSAEKVGIDMNDFFIACLDENSYESLKHYSNSFLYKDLKIKDYQDWTFSSNSGFRNIVKHKWNIIEHIHKKNPNLCWVDTDIVFLENPIQYIEDNEEVLFQKDYPGSVICSGFMVFNETVSCKELIEECSSYKSEDDQLIVNKIALEKYSNNIALLNVDLFPNGYAYYSENKKENAIIVHNNWITGIENKIQKFKEENLWFL